MNASKGWLALGWGAVLSIAYVGHGLHERANNVMPFRFEQSTQAQEESPKETFKWQWQLLDAGGGGPMVFRAKVPGGWLVRFLWSSGQSKSMSLTYLPDPEHKWDGSTIP